MLEKPDLPNEKIAVCLRDSYGLAAAEITFLPLGYDVNTAVYRVSAGDGAHYFLKLRGGPFDELAVAVPQFLGQLGIGAIIGPIHTKEGQPWARVEPFTAIVYPFVEGQNGFEIPVPAQLWPVLGASLKRIHTAALPPALKRRLPQETYSPRWRDLAKAFQASAERTPFADAVAAQLAAFMRAKRDAIADLIGRAEQLAQALQARQLEMVLCHADIHAGNVLITPAGELYIVDWDTLALAPKERDLMFPGAGLCIADAPHEEALFYQGYGQTDIDAIALAYYRYERIVEDIAAYCEQLLATDAGGADREQALGYFVGLFAPGQVVERAYASDPLHF